VFSAAWERDAIEAAARRAGVPFLGIWLEAPADVCVQRVANRRGDVSDADAGVVQAQFARETGSIRWVRLDASGDTGGIALAALGLLGAESR
jgi:predicted kinase